MKIQQKILLVIAIVALMVDVLYLAVQYALNAEAIGIDPVHTALLLFGYGSLAVYLGRRHRKSRPTPMQDLGRSVIAVTAVLLVLGAAQLTLFSSPSGDEIPAAPGAAAMVTGALLAIVASVASLAIIVALTGMVFTRPRPTTRRNYLAMLASFLVYAALEFLSDPVAMDINGLVVLRHVASGVLTLLMLINSFRFSWILDLSRREKLIVLLLSFFGFAFFLTFALFTAQDTPVGEALRHYHVLVYALVSSVALFGTMYLGVGFASTLLHLPTAKEFDRKKAEISSLQNMSRLITQVFDFDELVATTTHLALEVSEGSAAWLELNEQYSRLPSDSNVAVVPHSMRNITAAQIDALRLVDGRPVSALALESGKPVLIADLPADARVRSATPVRKDLVSLAIIPLNTHGGIIGTLCVGKKEYFDFDRDSTNVLLAFGDMVAIALENSQLIHESIVKERLEQEMLVAQQMQRSLLPQKLPSSEHYDIAARSEPAYEVGGDYYDVLHLDDHRIGFVIGDVSGKGVSAALYMAQVKGVFQSLGTEALSVRDILVRMNTPLCHGMERKSFISMLYAVLDTRNGQLTFSRAGHCPLLHVSNGTARYLQPSGMALGLDLSDRFAASLEEETISLGSGDFVVMYTDGVTETRDPEGNEFDYGRLADLVNGINKRSADHVLDGIVTAVRDHRASETAQDDVTLVVLHWKGEDLNNPQKQIH